MKLKFIDARFKNFFSFGRVPQEISYIKGMNLILGSDEARGRSNASGKSSLMEVIPFALFGRTNKGVTRSQIPNWRNRKNCEVHLRFQKDDSIYEIMRAIKPDKLEIYKDGHLIPQASDVRIYQKQLEEILNLDYHTFIALVHTNLNSHIPILKMESVRKRQFLERVFGLEMFSKLNDTANKKLKIVTDNIYKIKVDRDGIDDIIKRLEEQNTSLRRKISEIKSSDNELREVKKNRTELHKHYGKEPEKRYEKLRLGLQKHKDMLESKVDECEKIRKEETKVSIDGIDSKIKKINIEVDAHVTELNKEQALITKYDTRIELKQGDVKVSKGEDTCPTCGAPIDDIELCAKKEKEIVELKEKIATSKEKRANESTIINDLKKELKELMKVYKSTSINGFTSPKIGKIEDQIKTIQENISDTKEKIEDIKKGITELNLLKQEIENLEQKISRETEARKGIEEIISNNEAKMSELQVKMRENMASLTRMSSITDYLDYIKTVCRDDNIKQFAISAIIPYLTKQTNHYLAESGANFYVKFDKWLEETIEGPGIFNCEYNNLSGGESRSVDLALQFAFLDVARIQAQVFPDILILDELLDSSVDATGLVSVLNIIKARQKEDESKIFLVTHRTEISDIDVDNIYTVFKKDGFSHLKKM